MSRKVALLCPSGLGPAPALKADAIWRLPLPLELAARLRRQQA